VQRHRPAPVRDRVNLHNQVKFPNRARFPHQQPSDQVEQRDRPSGNHINHSRNETPRRSSEELAFSGGTERGRSARMRVLFETPAFAAPSCAQRIRSTRQVKRHGSCQMLCMLIAQPLSCGGRRSPVDAALTATLLSVTSMTSVLSVACVRPAAAATISVPAAGDLHAALMNSQPGDTIELERGATYVGNFTLPAKGGSAFITIRAAGPDPVPEGSRVTPQDAASLPKLRSPNNQPALQTAPGAHHWRVTLVEFQANAGGDGDLIALGDGSSAQNSSSQVPHDLVIDRCYIHGDAALGQKRCIALNSASTSVTNSDVSDCKTAGQDAQAIAGWNGPGPFTIVNNYLEGSSENVMFGGADPSIDGLVPSDIRISGNLISKPMAWRGAQWQVKNLVELKNARRVTIDQNVIQYSWEAAQTGFTILFTVRNQDGHCPWCQVEQVDFEHNLVQHGAGGISILGIDDTHPSLQTQSITIRNNIFADIDNVNWGGSGYCFQLIGGPRDVVIDHNTLIQEHASGIIQMDGPVDLGFIYTNNLGQQNAYGFIGTNHAPGNDSITAFLPGSQIRDNVIADADAQQYPAGNLFPSSAQFRSQFVSYSSGNYQLIPQSPWRGAGTDGGDLGADQGIAAKVPDGNPPGKLPRVDRRGKRGR
jgi:hypothetical protein